LKSANLNEPVLVGREHELEELQAAFESTISGKGTTVFVSGEAGCGKTRITNEFLEIARKHDITILTGWCLSNAPVPYFPFLEAFGSYISGNEESASIASQQLGLKTWLMTANKVEGFEKNENVTPQVWKDQTFAAVTKELLFMSTEKPTVLVLEDIHWADSASLSLLHFVSRAIGSERLFVLATFRSEELNPPAEGQPHPLVETLRLMGREDLFTEIKLPNLNEPDVGRIAESMLSGSIHPELKEKLAKESQGNPLFVVESVKMLFEHGDLVQEQGQWKLSSEKRGIPLKVKDIILRRISILKLNERRILDVASVIGDVFDPELLGAVLNLDSLQVLETLNTIAQFNSLVCCEDQFFRFDHAKSREVLYEEIRPPLRRGYHGRIAEIIEVNNQKFKEHSVSDLAYHYVQAGNKEKSVKYSLLAGQEALIKFSNSEAIKHFNYVLQTISETTENSDEKRTALEGLGDAYYGNCMFKNALKTFEQLSNTETGIVRLRAFRKAMDAAFFMGNLTHLLELTQKMGEYTGDHRLENARVHMNIGRAFSNMGKNNEGLNEMEKALQVFEEECSLPDAARALMGVAIIAVSNSQLEKACVAALRSVALYEELNDLRGQMDANNRAGQVSSICRFTEESWRKYTKAIEIGEKIGDYNRLAEAMAFSSLSLEYAGNIEEAVSRSLKAAEYVKKTDSEVTQGIVYSALTRQYAKLGNLIQAEEYFKKLSVLPSQVLLNGMTAYPLSKAIFFAAKSQWNDAIQYFEESLKILKIHVNPHKEFLTRANYSWVLNKQGQIGKAQVQIEEAKRITGLLIKSFQYSNVKAAMIAPTEVEADKEFTIRLDIVNIGKKPGSLVRVEGLIVPEFKIETFTDNCSLKNGFVSLKEKILGPFKVEPIKLSLLATKAGVYNISPQVDYIDSMGENRTCKPNSVTLTVKPKNSKVKLENTIISSSQILTQSASFETPKLRTTTDTQNKFEFKTESARKTFNFLVIAFVEDYMKRRIAQEKAGWRSLNEIVEEGKIPRYSVYGKGRNGAALSELERRGLVEARIFPGERGRGGKIIRARVCYDKETIKREIDYRVMRAP
jgi:tetratricopeptide (TPR) repeat protein